MLLEFLRLFARFSVEYDAGATDETLVSIMTAVHNDFLGHFQQAFYLEHGYAINFSNPMFEALIDGPNEMALFLENSDELLLTHIALLIWQPGGFFSAAERKALSLLEGHPDTQEILWIRYPSERCGRHAIFPMTGTNGKKLREIVDLLKCENWDETMNNLLLETGMDCKEYIFTLLNNNLEGFQLFVAELLWAEKLDNKRGIARALAVALEEKDDILLRLVVWLGHNTLGVLHELRDFSVETIEEEGWDQSLEFLFL